MSHGWQDEEVGLAFEVAFEAEEEAFLLEESDDDEKEAEVEEAP